MSTYKASEPSATATLLMTSAHAHIDEHAAARVRALAHAGVNWPLLLHLASLHDTPTLLYHTFSTVIPDMTPPDILRALRADHRRAAISALTQARALLRMLHAFGERGVDALPYKGPVLAEMAYGDLALRRSIDVDVLVRRRDVQPARETLAALGYALSEECRLHEQAYAHAHHHLVFKNMQNGVTLELHWQTVTPQFSFDLSFDALWKNSIMTSLASQTVRSPSVEDTLLLVCVHASMHGWKQLKQVCDVAELLRRYPSANWGALQRRAQALGALRMLRLGVLLAHEALDAPLPAALAVADDAVAQQLCREIMNQLTSDTVAIGEADQRSFPGYHARLRERRRERVSEALRRVFIPNMDDWRALALPDSLVFLHYVLRPLRLARRGLASFWQMLRRRP